MNEKTLLELQNMLKYPSLHRAKIHLWIKTGQWERHVAKIEDLEFKELLKDLYKTEFEKLCTDDLMVMYARLLGSRKTSSKDITEKLTKNWVRVSPSKRG